MRAQLDAGTTVVALNGTAVVEGPFGTDRNGSVVWRFRLPEPTTAGKPVHIDYRKEYSGKPTRPLTSQYLSLASRSEHPYERGQFVADFSRCSEKPVQAVRFVTPTGTLPHLEDRSWPIKLQGNELVADFDLFVAHHSHGIYWWFEEDQYFRNMRRAGQELGDASVS